MEKILVLYGEEFLVSKGSNTNSDSQTERGDEGHPLRGYPDGGAGHPLAGRSTSRR